MQIFASPFQTQIHIASYFHRNTTSQHCYFGGTTKIRGDIKTHFNLNIYCKAQIKLKTKQQQKIGRNGDLLMDMFCSLSVLLLRIFKPMTYANHVNNLKELVKECCSATYSCF